MDPFHLQVNPSKHELKRPESLGDIESLHSAGSVTLSDKSSLVSVSQAVARCLI